MYEAYRQITIDGTTYTADEMRAAEGGKSTLEEAFGKRYGTESFYADVAQFLAEWFADGPTIKVHTSGSTGKPKELWVEKERMMNSARMTLDFLGLQQGDSALLCMPLPYIAGKMVVVRAIVGRLNLKPITPSGHPLKEVSTPLQFAAMIPMQVFNSLQVEEERQRLMSIGHLIIGGGAIDKEMGKALQSFPNRVWSTYGMTETLSHIALRRISGKEASAWYTPFDNVRLSLSEEGTLVINAPKVSAEELTTNDMVQFNPQGQFQIIGRKDNIINTGGIKVQIEQVEEQLSQVLSVPYMITAAPDEKFGEKIVLLTTSSDREQIDKAIKTLPRYWQPKEIHTIKALPLTGTGKPDRAKAKEFAAQAK